MLKKKLQEEFLKDDSEKEQVSRTEGTTKLAGLDQVKDLESLNSFPALLIPGKTAFCIQAVSPFTIGKDFAQNFFGGSGGEEGDHVWMSPMGPGMVLLKSISKSPISINGKDFAFEGIEMLESLSTINLLGGTMVYIPDEIAWEEYKKG